MKRISGILLFLALLVHVDSSGDEGWELIRYLDRGEERKKPFRYLRLGDEHKGEVSNGVQSLPCWLKLVDGEFRFFDPSGLAWDEDRYFSESEGIFQNTGSKLVLVWPTLEQKREFEGGGEFSEEDLLEASGAWVFEKRELGDIFNVAENVTDTELREYVDKLIRLKVDIKPGESRGIRELDFTNSSVEEIDIKLLERLPGLQVIRVAKGGFPPPTSEQISIEVVDLSDDRKWKSKTQTAIAKLLHRGRQDRATLMPIRADGKFPPVFQTSPANEGGAMPASLLRFRDRPYAFYRHSSKAGSQPKEIVHSSLNAPVPLGRVVMSRLGFQISEIGGTPGDEWLFHPIREEATLFENGQVLRVCLPDGEYIDGVANVGVAFGIPPTGRIDWDTARVYLMADPDAGLPTLAGCPVVDQRTGYLVGFVQNVFEDEGLVAHLSTFQDLTALAEAQQLYDGLSFFGIEGRIPQANLPSHLVGVFPSGILKILPESGFERDSLLKRPFYHHNNMMELVGREYLFSQIDFPNSSVLNELDAKSFRLRNDDLRIRGFSRFLVSHLGPPDEFGGSFPDGENPYGKNIELRWSRDSYAIYHKISWQKVGNRISTNFNLVKATSSNPPTVKKIQKKQTGDFKVNDLLDEFFGWLDTQDPEVDHGGMNTFGAGDLKLSP